MATEGAELQLATENTENTNIHLAGSVVRLRGKVRNRDPEWYLCRGTGESQRSKRKKISVLSVSSVAIFRAATMLSLTDRKV